MRLPGKDRALRLTLNGVTERYGVRLRVTKNRFLTGVKATEEKDYVANVLTKPGDIRVVVGLADFLDSKKQPMPDWSNITTLSLDVIQKVIPFYSRSIGRLRKRRNSIIMKHIVTLLTALLGALYANRTLREVPSFGNSAPTFSKPWKITAR